MALDWTIRLYDAAGVEQPLPVRYILAWNFDVLESGGYNGFSITLAEELDGRYGLPAVPNVDWRFDFYFAGVPGYRGWGEAVRKSITNDSPLLTVDGMGIRGRFKTFVTNCRYAKAYGADASDAWSWFLSKIAANRGSSTDRLALGKVIQNPLDYVIERLDAFNSTLEDVLQNLADAASDSIVWGGDFIASALDRVYVKKKATSVLHEPYRLWIGRDVQWIEQPRDLAEIVNAVLFTGGDAKAPNLLFNPSFELPILAGEGESGNLLADPSFELGTGWTLNGASIEGTNDPGAYNNTGTKHLNLDNADSPEQTVVLPTAGPNSYRLTVHAAKERTSTAVDPAYLLLVQGLSAGNAVLETYFNNFSTVVNSREYSPQGFAVHVQNPGVAKLKVKITYSPPGTDILLDDIWLHRADALGQDGWSLGKPKGSVATALFDWAVQDPSADPYHGMYFVRLTTSGCDGGATNAVWLLPSEDHWVTTRVLTDYAFQVRIRSSGSLHYRMGLLERDSQGNVRKNYQIDSFSNTTGAAWPIGAIRYLVTTGQNTVAVRPFVEFRSNGTYEVDAFDFWEVAVEDRTDFLPGSQLELYCRADNGIGATVLPTGGSGGLSTDAQGSIAAYGLREKAVNIATISDLASAKLWIAAYLNRYSVPLVAGKVVLEPCSLHFRYVDETVDGAVQGMVGIGGAGVAIPDQSVARATYEMTPAGDVRLTLETTNRRPDPALLLASQGTQGGYQGGSTRPLALSGAGGINYTVRPGNSGSGPPTYSPPEQQVVYGPSEPAPYSHAGATDRTTLGPGSIGASFCDSLGHSTAADIDYPIRIYRDQARMVPGQDYTLTLDGSGNATGWTWGSGAYPVDHGDGSERILVEFTPVASD